MYVASNLVYLPVLLLKIQQGDTIYSKPLWWFSLSSAVLHLGYYIVLQKGYRNAELSVVYPLARGPGPLFSSIAAILFLHEPLSITATTGLFLIIAGVLLITGLSFKKEDNQKILTGITYGVLTGLLIALYTFNDTIAVKSYAVSPIPLTLGTSLLGAFCFFPSSCPNKMN